VYTPAHMLKPLKWAVLATLVNVLLGAAFIAIMRIGVHRYIETGEYMPLAFRVAFGVSVFIQRFWWFFVPLIFGGWCILCFIVHFIGSSSNTNAQAASGS
jgi:hypothetical protein